MTQFVEDVSTSLEAAIDDYCAALRLEPAMASALYGRDVAKPIMGDRVGGEADISAAKNVQTTIEDDFKNHGLKYLRADASLEEPHRDTKNLSALAACI